MDHSEKNIIQQLSQLAPDRPLTFGEAYQVAETQATTLLHLLDIRHAPADVGRLTELPHIEVQVEPRWRMPTLAGFSEWRNGHWLIVINRNSGAGRRRFTLAHELKHVIDHPARGTLYAQVGGRDEQERKKRIERICDHFAACFLMPRPWVKRAWANGIQDIDALAELFNVSAYAMKIRLAYLGFLDDEDRPVISYFRGEAHQTFPAV